PGEAVEAALRAQHTTRAADLLVEIALIPEFGAGQTPQAAAAEFHTMRRWLDQIPDHELEARPPLLLAYATAILFAMLIDQMPVPVPVQQQIAQLLERAEAGFLARGDIARLGRVFAFRSLLLREIGASEQSVDAARQALVALAPDDLVWRSIALGAVGLGALSDGNLAEAAGMLEEALACCERIGNSWWIRANLGMLSYAILERGQLRKAHARFKTLLAEAREQQDADDIGRMQLALAVIAYERNELESAWEAATEAYETALRLQNHEVSIAAAVLLAQLEHVGDNQAAAQQRLYVLQAQLQGYAAPMRERLHRQVERAQALFALAQGDLAAVQQWAERWRQASEGVPRLVREREQRVLARLLLVQGAPQAALELLQPMAQAAEQEERGRCRVEIDILRMQALGALQRTDEAASILRALTERAGPEGFVRSFLDEGPPLLELIAALARNSDSLAVRLHVRALLQHRLGAGVPA
ncbi:MAG TPA: hypothetical protein VFT99_16985, partial [Roseiflexaceae bacterium]|nr:hypothetical protein [Roseiflexaceae bacterium]